MARGRFISKGISLDEVVNSLSDDTARLLFTWLIPHLDCEGRCHGDAMTVKSIVFPRRKISAAKVEKYLQELEKKELIVRYSVNGNQYLWAENFEKHQVGLRKSQESPSQIPPFTTELNRGNNVITPSQVKTKVQAEAETKVKTSCSRCSSKEEVISRYEDNIGPVTEALEGEIDIAIKRFSAPWVGDAIKESVLQNKPAWVYIAGILKNWEKYGREQTQ